MSMSVSTTALIKKMYIDVEPRVMALRGYDQLDRTFSGFVGKQKAAALQGKLLADSSERDAQRLAHAWEGAQDRAQIAADRSSRLAIRYEEVKAVKGEEAARRYEIAWLEAYRRAGIAADRATAAQTAALTGVSGATAARSRAAALGRYAAVGAGLNFAGNVVGGAGVLGLGLGYETLHSGINWQTFVSQQVANSPMSAQQQKAFQALSLRIAVRDGANPQDVFTALRYGSEMNLNQRQDRRYLSAALSLGLPTGGSTAVPSSLFAIAKVAKNFPHLANRPNAIANMILAASQNAPATSVADFVEAMPSILSMAGHIGGDQQLPEALAMVAAMRQAGIPLPESETQGKNFLKVLMTGAARKGTLTYRTLDALKQQRGIDLFSDFSQKGLQQKGLSGVINDIKGANLSQATLLNLFPNMRGVMAAMGLTGNLNKNYNEILSNPQHGLLNAAQNNPMGANMARYMGLTSTETKKLDEQLKILSITVGTELLPPFNELLKDVIVPGVKDVAAFTHEHKDLIAELIKASPYLIGAGITLKAVGAGLKVITGEGLAATVLKNVAGALAGSGTATIEGASAAAIGETAGATGLAGVAATLTGIAAVAAPVVVVLGAFKLLADHLSKSPIAGTANPGSNTTDAIPARFWVGPGVNRHVSNPSFDNPGGGRHVRGGSMSWSQLVTNLGGTNVAPGHPGYANPAEFGIHPVSYYDAITGHFSKTVTAGNNANLAYAGGGPAVHDWDYGVPIGTPIKLPGGKGTKYTVKRSYYYKGVGWIESFRDPTGGTFSLDHLSKDYVKQGQIVTGGVVVGRSGAPTNTAYGHGAHLSVIADARATAFLTGKGVKVGPGYSGSDVDWSKVPKAVAQYASIIEAAAQKYGVPAALIASVIWTESRGDAGAMGPWVGNHRAYGLMQIMDYNFAGLGLGDKDWANPTKNIMAGTRLLKGNLNTSKTSPDGQLYTALNAYSGGGANMPYGGTGKTYYQYTAGNAAKWKGDGSGANVNLGGKGGRPTNPAGWAQWYASQASGISGNLSFYGNQFAAEHGPNWGPHSLSPGEWKFTVNLLDALYGFQYQEALSRANADFPHNANRRAAAQALAKNVYHRELAHPFKYGPFASSASASIYNRASPVQVVGSNKQLAVAEEHLREARKQTRLLEKHAKQNEQALKKKDKEIAALVRWINHHGGHAHINNATGVVVVGGPGG